MKKVYLVGAGPGDPDLLTIKAIKSIRKADVILYDHLVFSRILGYAKRNTELIYVGKQKKCHSKSQTEINNLLVKLTEKYNYIVRLKGGDPSVFGRAGEEYQHLIQNGIDCEIIPGITAASGAAASFGIPLSHRNYSSEIIYITGHKKDSSNRERFSEIDLSDKTVVVYMGGANITEILEEISQNGENLKLPLAIIESASLPNQKIITTTVGNLLQELPAIKSPSLLIIGRVVEFREEMEKLKEIVFQKN